MRRGAASVVWIAIHVIGIDLIHVTLEDILQQTNAPNRVYRNYLILLQVEFYLIEGIHFSNMAFKRLTIDMADSMKAKKSPN